jgi:predicted membrane chloride channel (bestrophin family)
MNSNRPTQSYSIWRNRLIYSLFFIIAIVLFYQGYELKQSNNMQDEPYALIALILGIFSISLGFSFKLSNSQYH